MEKANPEHVTSEFSSQELRSVGNYTISHLVGKGSFGKVYLAEHKLIRGSKVCRSRESEYAKEMLILLPGRSQVCGQE